MKMKYWYEESSKNRWNIWKINDFNDESKDEIVYKDKVFFNFPELLNFIEKLEREEL